MFTVLIKKALKQSFKVLGIILTSFIVLGLLARALFFEGPFLTPEEVRVEDKIVDIHIHTAGLGLKGEKNFLAAQLENSYKFNFYINAFGVSVNEVKAEGDKAVVASLSRQLSHSRYVDKAVVLALDGVIDDNGQLDRAKTQVYVDNDFVHEEIQKYDNLLFGASINPKRPDAIERLHSVHKKGAVLIKWLPSIQHFDPANPAFTDFYRELSKLGMPLLVHTGDERSFVDANDELGDPLKLRLALESGVTVIAAHVATTGESENQDNVERLFQLMDEFDHLYADISSLTQINKLGYLKEILQRKKYNHRFVYGSDMPLAAIVALVSPLYFPFNLKMSELIEILSIKNPWDRDVLLKKSLGLPREVFLNTDRLLN